jgi:Flp pilus assembly protein TadG
MKPLRTRTMQLEFAKQTLRSTPSRAGISSSQSGQALIEMAFVVPMLLLLLLGVIEIGRYAYIAILVGNAARAGADYGAQSRTLDTVGIQNAAYYDFAGSKNGTPPPTNGQAYSNLTVASSQSCGCDSGGTVTSYACSKDPDSCPAGSRWVVFVSVTASGSFNGLFNYPGIPKKLVISRTAVIPVA